MRIVISLGKPWHAASGTYRVHDFSEPHFDGARVDMFMSGRMMDQFRELPLPHLACSVTEDEKERVDGVGFPGTVGTDDCAEGLSNNET